MNTLTQFHLVHGAVLEDVDGIGIPMRYGSRFEQEIQTMLQGAGIFDASTMMEIQVKGPDSLQFLQGLVTNDLNDLEVGKYQPNLICTSRGKIEHRLEIICLDKKTFLICCARGEGLAVGRKLDQFHIREDLQFSVLNSNKIRIDMIGVLTKKILEKKGWSTDTFNWKMSSIEIQTVDAPVNNFPRFIHLVPLLEAVTFIETMSEEPETGLVGQDSLKDLQTHLGHPQFGMDYGVENFPQEAALGDHISFNKGCYVGQEPHARMYHRGHPNWILVQLQLPEDMVVSSGVKLYVEDQKVGTLTSLSSIQEQDFRNGIGMIRHQIAGTGQDLTIENNKNALIRQQPLPYQI